MIVVTGPRIDPATLPQAEGLELRAYVHNLYRHLAACDLAVVQGGLTTAMELTANRRPFLYFPLRHHFEQNFHVRHRLERYGAGRRMDFETRRPGGDRRRDRRGDRARGRLPPGRDRRRSPRGRIDRGAPLSRGCRPRAASWKAKLRGPPSGRPRSALRAWVRKSGRRRRERRSACEPESSTLRRPPGQRSRSGGDARRRAS